MTINLADHELTIVLKALEEYKHSVQKCKRLYIAPETKLVEELEQEVINTSILKDNIISQIENHQNKRN